MRDWSWREGFFPAEECDRQLMIGTLADKDKIPQAIKDTAVSPSKVVHDNSIVMAQGLEAYRHLLNVAVGMLDKNLGEKETIEAIRKRWQAFSEGEPYELKTPRIEKFGKIMQALFADSKAVRAKVFEDRVGGNYLRPISSEPIVAARNMLDIKTVDTSLLIGEKEGITTHSIMTLDMAYRTQRKQESGLGGPIVTHPDPVEARRLEAQITQMRRDKLIKSNIRFVDYATAMKDIFPKADFVFNCQPMDNGPADDALIALAKARTNPTSMLVHLKGVPQRRNSTSEKWRYADVEHVIFTESIKRQHDLDHNHNQRMRALAERAITNCLTSRQLGRQPVQDMILLENADYAAFVSRAPIHPRSEGRRSPLDHAKRSDKGTELHP